MILRSIWPNQMMCTVFSQLSGHVATAVLRRAERANAEGLNDLNDDSDDGRPQRPLVLETIALGVKDIEISKLTMTDTLF
eukprot:8363762-Pyramimonas_sp.AAC.1